MSGAIFLDGNRCDNLFVGGGGGASAEAVLDNGQISTTSSYSTASFSDISGYEYVLVRLRDTVSSVDYVDYKYIKVSDISSSLSFTCTLHRSIICAITTTSISAVDYAGSYYDIYADIIGLPSDLFDILT